MSLMTSFPDMNERFTNQMEKIISLTNNTETYIMGDINVDFNIMNKQEVEKINYEKNFNNMIETIQSKLLGNNFTQLISESTRNNKILDHIYANKLNKIMSVNVEHSTSDHKFTTLTRKMKIDSVEQKFFFSRKWKDVNYDTINDNIIMSENYINMIQSKDLNSVTNELINTIQSQLDNAAPLKKIKIIEKCDKISSDTNKLIKQKNKIYKELKNSNDPNLKREFKILSSRCRKAITNDRNNDTKKVIYDNIKNPKKLWQQAKKELFGNDIKQPERIIDNGNLIKGSKNVANSFNRFFIKKVKNIINEIPRSQIDPMSFYRQHVPNLSNQFNFKNISMYQLRNSIKKINKTTSTDYYGISMNILKNLMK